MAIKSVSIRIEEEMLEKLRYGADYEGRSVNSRVPVSYTHLWDAQADRPPSPRA